MSNITTDNKSGVVYRVWQASRTEAVLILIHGMGAHGERWNFCAEFFRQNNISSYALELRGFGAAGGVRGHVDSFETYYKDTLRLAEIALSENNGKKIFIIGESMGGLVAFETALLNPNVFSGVVCASPAFGNVMRIPLSTYFGIFSSFLTNPKKQFAMPFDSAMCTRDASYQKVMDSNPLEYRSASARLLVEIATIQAKAMLIKRRIGSPVLFLLSGDDKMVSVPVAEKIFNKLDAKDKKMIRYPGMYHALSIDLGREKVFGDILEWVKERT